jgi:hypothetical protein
VKLRESLRVLRPAVMPGVYLLFTLAVFWPLWTPIEGGRGSWRFDPRYEYWGDLVFQARTLMDGVIGMWNPHDRGGFPLYGDPQPGLLYPPNWPIWIWGLVADGVPYLAITVKILAHWLFGAVGMHLLLRRLKVAEPGCYVGGIIFGWSCPKMRYGGSALNWSLAWIPWVLLAAHWFAERPSKRRGVVLGTTVAMLLLAGAPAVMLYMLVIAVPFGLYALRGRLRASLGAIAFSAGVAALWLAPLVVSNLEQLPASVRQTRDFAFVAGSAFTPGHVISFLVPRASGENVYFGLLPLLAAGAVVAALRPRALVLLGVAAAGVALALGEHAGVMPAVASSFKPFALFRQAHRYMFITSTAMAVLAGLGVGYLIAVAGEERARLARRLTWVASAVTFAVGMALLVAYVMTDRVTHPKVDAFGLAFLSCAAGTWLVRALLTAGEARRALVAWLVVVLVALDLWTASSHLVKNGFTPPPVMRHDVLATELPGLETEWRVYDYGLIDYRPGTRLGIRDFGGYEDDPLGLSRYTEFLGAAKRNLRLFGHANVRWITVDPKRQPPIRPPADWKAQAPNVFEVPEVAPAVFYVPRPVRVGSPGEALQKLAAMVPGQTAVVEGQAPEGPAGAGPVAGRLVTLEPNRLVAEIETPGPGLVVVSEAYFPAWQATVNGEPVELVPANAMFRGVPVAGAGVQRIEMQLSPFRFWGLLPLYLAAMLLLALAISPGWERLRGLRRPRTSTPPRSGPPTA